MQVCSINKTSEACFLPSFLSSRFFFVVKEAFFLASLAVQHERGPRKPKFRDHPDLKVTSLPHHHPHSTVALTAHPAFSKSINSVLDSRHHHHSIMSKIPPPMISSANGNGLNSSGLMDQNGSSLDQLGGLFSKQLDGCPLGAMPSVSLANTSTFFDGSNTPPGLLQMLLNAEKSQELIWNSIRSSVGNHISSTAPPPALPFLSSRLFDTSCTVIDNNTVSPTHQQSVLLPAAFSNSAAAAAAANLSHGGLFSPPFLVSSTTPSSSSAESEASLSDAGDGKSLSSRGLNCNPLFSSISFPKPLSSQWDSVHEVTARLLFMVIRWVKCLPTFRTLSKNDQVARLNLLA